MLALLLAFAVLHSGGASLRAWGAERIGETGLAAACLPP
jgi:hypothetical protein